MFGITLRESSRAALVGLLFCSGRLSCCIAGLRVGASPMARRPACVHWHWRMRGSLHYSWYVARLVVRGAIGVLDLARPLCCRAAGLQCLARTPTGLADMFACCVTPQEYSNTAIHTPSHVQTHWQVLCASCDNLRTGVRARACVSAVAFPVQ